MNDLESLDCGKNKNKNNIIYYNGEDDIKELISRNDLLKDKKNKKSNPLKFTNDMIKKGNVYYMPVDIHDTFYTRYQITTFGTLVSGVKAKVVIENIDVFFDIKVPLNFIDNPEQFKSEILIDLSTYIELECVSINHSNNNLNYLKIDIIYSYPLVGYKEKKEPYLRIYTETLYQRKNIINKYAGCYYLCNNDINKYYRKAAREYKLSFNDWIIIKNFKHTIEDDVYVFNVDIKDFVKIPLDDKILSNPMFINDKTLIIAWDIETYSSNKMGELPIGKNITDNVFMICFTIHWLYSDIALYRICISDKKIESDSRWLSIVCKNELNVIRAMAICWSHFKPDIFSGFNDSSYDWRFIIDKTLQYEIFPWFWRKMSLHDHNINDKNILKVYYSNGADKEMKISSEKKFMYICPIIPGTVCIDCLPCYMKIYPRSEVNKFGSLKFYLNDNNLPSKIDLSALTMWKYYEDGLPSKLREIAYYCIVDSISVQRLLLKRNIIYDYRGISSLSYVSLYDSHYFAGGMKVCNMLCSYAYDMNISINMNRNKKSGEKFPGAYVFPPDKGITPNNDNIDNLLDCKDEDDLLRVNKSLYKDRPVICLDFASLYPNIIITYNLSPEKMILTEEDYDKLSNTLNLHTIEFESNAKIIKAWSVKHENSKINMGLFPMILEELFNKRKSLKKDLQLMLMKKEIYEKILNVDKNDQIKLIDNMIIEFTDDDMFKVDILNDIKINIDKIVNDYNEISFKCKLIDSKQNALKIMMNSFYGETGNSSSPYFLLQLAGGVTSGGRYNIKLIADFVKKHDYFIKYGDTDSLYIIAPSENYLDIDRKYSINCLTREEYFTELVKHTLNKIIPNIQSEINSYISNIHGSSYLRMENEGCQFPCVFLGKKKYFGIQHVHDVNFKPKKIYIKGIDIIKQGKSNIEKEIGKLIMQKSLSIDNKLNLLSIVKSTLHEALNTDKWNMEDFIQTSTWKPKIQNQRVQSFIKRMNEMHEIEKQKNRKLIESSKETIEYEYLPLENGERFSYVLVKLDNYYDIKGRKINVKVGDIMEYVHIAKKYNKQIDVMYYVLNYIIGICARFINSDDQFQPDKEIIEDELSDDEELSENDDDKDVDEKYIDKYSREKAKKYLINYIKDLQGISDQKIKEDCSKSRNLFNNAVQYTIDRLPRLQTTIPLQKIIMSKIDFKNKSQIIDSIFKEAKTSSELIFKKYNKNYAEKVFNYMGIENSIYNLNILRKLNKTDNMRKIELDLKNYLFKRGDLLELIYQYHNNILTIINKLKNDDDIDDINIDEDRLNEFINIWYKIIGIELYKIKSKSCNEYYEHLLSLQLKIPNKPSKIEIKKTITNAVKNII